MAYNVIIALLLSLFCFKALKACTDDQYTVFEDDGRIVCVDCEACPPGHGLSSKCGTRISSKTKVICVPCQRGVNFSSEFDTSSCQPCDSPCVEGQKIIQECTPRTNVLCEKYCNDYNRYYDVKKGCLPCSCCGENMQYAVEDECQQKLGEQSNMICSAFNSSTTGCTSMPSPIVTEATTDDKSHEDETANWKVKAVIIAAVVGPVIIALIVNYYCRCFSFGRCHRFLRPAKQNAREIDLDPLTQSQKENSKPLKTLLDNQTSLEKICEVLDTKMPLCGNYKEVAEYYGFSFYQIKSRLETSLGGPSRALIEWLAATYPHLKVKEFASVIKETTKRNDVIVLLNEFDNDENQMLMLP